MPANKHKKAKLALGALASLGAIGIAAYAAYRLQRKYTVFSEQDTSFLDCVEPDKLAQFQLEDKSHESSARIKEAVERFEDEKETASFPAFTAFEMHMRSIDKLIYPNSEEDKGLKSLAGRLQSRKVIDQGMRDQIDEYVFTIRNKTFHGKPIPCFDKLKEAIDFIAQFISAHPISRYEIA